ncbi:MAG: hypothetical protein AAGA56_15560 [Myxococcota bacterium]
MTAPLMVLDRAELIGDPALPFSGDAAPPSFGADRLDDPALVGATATLIPALRDEDISPSMRVHRRSSKETGTSTRRRSISPRSPVGATPCPSPRRVRLSPAR